MTRTVHFLDKECFINYFTKTKKHHGSGKKSQIRVNEPERLQKQNTVQNVFFGESKVCKEQVKPKLRKAVPISEDDEFFGDPFQSPMPSTSNKRKVQKIIVSFTLQVNSISPHHLWEGVKTLVTRGFATRVLTATYE
jgi:hypothetical protein